MAQETTPGEGHRGEVPAETSTRPEAPRSDPSNITAADDTYATRPEASDERRASPHDDASGYSTRMWGHRRSADAKAIPRGEVPGYEIKEVLGRGGMGVVYKALQTRANRLVALKMILGDGHLRADQLERFRIEAESVAGLRHPNVVQVYDVGEVDGLPYFSLELLEGGSLAERLAGTPMPPRQAAGLLGLLAGAVHAAHRAGIVHRDLKPANILFDSEGTPKVVDFGLAKRLESEGGHTITGQIMGTPAYMAPEQARGDNREVGPLADVHALGAILYEAITGRPPFKGPSIAETLHMVISDDPVPPARLQSGLSRDLETICLKCLAKEPSRRYASAGELADDLARYLGGEPIHARPTPAWERALKWSRKRPATALTLALVVVALVAGGVWAERYESLRHRRARDEGARLAAARLEAVDALDRGNRERAKGDWQAARLALSNLITGARGEPALADLLRRAESDLGIVEGKIAEGDSRVEALDRLSRFRRARDEALFRDTPFAESLGEAVPLAARAAADAALAAFDGLAPADSTPGLLGPIPPSLTADQRSEVGDGQYLMLMVKSEATARALVGEEPKARALEALAILDRASGLREASPAYHLRRASCLDRAGEARAAQDEREAAARLAPTGAFDHLLLGQEWARRLEWDKARGEFEAALRDKPDLFWARCLLGVAELNGKPPRVAEARAELTNCLIREPSYAWLRLLRGFAQGQVGASLATAARLPGGTEALLVESEARFEDAEGDFAEALRLGLDGPLRYALLVDRGAIRYQRRRFEAAAADFEAAIALDDRRHNGHLLLAQALRQLKRPAEAIDQLDRAVDRAPGLPELYRERALARLERGDPPRDADRVLADLEEAARREPAASRLAAGDQARRGKLLLKLDRPTEALAAAEAALTIAPDLADAHLARIGALLDLGRHLQVIQSCDAAMARGKATPDLHRLRGLARAGRGDFAAAIEDYTTALAGRRDWPEVEVDRGWSYLFADAPALALRDFDAAIRRAPSDPDGLAGRAACRIRLGQPRDALADVEASLKLGDPAPRTLYNAARVYAQAATRASAEVAARGRPATRDAKNYENRAADLLRQAVDRTPAIERDRWLRDVVALDPALKALRRTQRPAR